MAQHLHKSGKPILVAVNKVDTFRTEKGMDEFAALGFDKIFPVSAIHGEGIQNLMNEATALLPQSEEREVHSAESEKRKTRNPESER